MAAITDGVDAVMTDTAQSEAVQLKDPSSKPFNPAQELLHSHGSSASLTSTAIKAPDSTRALPPPQPVYATAMTAAFTPFLERPPEIRNLIYKALFEHDGPVTLKVYQNQKLRQWDAIRAVPDHDILFTCTTIYNEAIGIMFSQNTWLITCGSQGSVTKPYLIDTVGDWLVSMGKQLASVRKIQIDAMSEEIYRYVPNMLHVTALLKSFKKVQEARKLETTSAQRATDLLLPHIEFAAVKEAFRPKLLQSQTEIAYKFHHNAMNSTLEVLLKAIVSDNTNIPTELRNLLRCRRSLDQVVINDNGGRIEVVLSTRVGMKKRGFGDNIRVIYDRCMDGRFRKVTSPSETANIHKVIKLGRVGEQIFGHLLKSPGVITYDLENSSCSRTLPGIGAMQASRCFREVALKNYYRNNKFVIKFVANPPQSCGETFASLYNFFEYQHEACAYEHLFDHLVLQLRIVPITNMQISDIRLDCIGFLKATAIILEADVCTLLAAPDSKEERRVGHRGLDSLRHQMLDFLVRLMDEYPHCCLLSRPEVYMDSQCNIVEAQVPLRNGIHTAIHIDRSTESDEVPDEKVHEYFRRLESRSDLLSMNGRYVGGWNTLLGCALEIASMTSAWHNIHAW